MAFKTLLKRRISKMGCSASVAPSANCKAVYIQTQKPPEAGIPGITFTDVHQLPRSKCYQITAVGPREMINQLIVSHDCIEVRSLHCQTASAIAATSSSSEWC